MHDQGQSSVSSARRFPVFHATRGEMFTQHASVANLLLDLHVEMRHFSGAALAALPVLACGVDTRALARSGKLGMPPRRLLPPAACNATLPHTVPFARFVPCCGYHFRPLLSEVSPCALWLASRPSIRNHSTQHSVPIQSCRLSARSVAMPLSFSFPTPVPSYPGPSRVPGAAQATRSTSNLGPS